VQTYGGDQDKSVSELSQALNKVRADKSKDYMKYQTGLGGVPASELYKMYPAGDLSAKNIDRYLPLIQSAADTYQLDPNLIKSVILHESAGNSQAVSPKGAKGLMQLMDGTADSLGVTNALDPEQNIKGGSRYLRQLLDAYQGDESLALAAYNAGPNNVAKYAGIPPFPETVNYVKNVLEGKKQFNQLEIKQ
jgi:soluble lytic murein transglycosylase-like protein